MELLQKLINLSINDNHKSKLKQTKILFNVLTTNSSSIFYGADRISKDLLK